MKFLVDMPVTPQAVEFLSARGHEAVHAFAIGLGTSPDEVILERARKEGRIVVTADLDYPRLLALLEADQPGVLLFRGGSYSDVEMLSLLGRVLAAVEPAELAVSLTVVDRRRVRRRHLPLKG